MDSTSDPSTPEAKSNDNMDLLASMTLPQDFVQDPASFLTLIASKPASPERLSLLAGPLAKWFKDAQVSSPAPHVSHLYLCAAAKQLADSPSVASIAASSVLASMAMTNDKNRAKHQEETLEGVIAAALLCPNRSAIGTSGILPVVANLVRATSASDPGASNIVASSIASSLSNLPSASSTAFPPLTLVHTAFLQCAVLAQEYQAAETVIRGTWPVPTLALKSKKGRVRDNEDHAAVSIIMKYYYLRGIIHYECGQNSLAHRCWWTCLSIPVEVVTNTALEAWKKLTLVQPLLDMREFQTSKADSVDANNDGPSVVSFSVGKKKTAAHPATRLPKCMPKGLSKSIYALIEGSRKSQASSEEGTEEPSPLSLVYAHLGPAVEAVDRKAVQDLLVAHESQLLSDGNLGMARNCLKRVKDLQD